MEKTVSIRPVLGHNVGLALPIRQVFARSVAIPLTRQTSLIMKQFDQVCFTVLNVFVNKPGGSINTLINCSKTIDRRPNFRRCMVGMSSKLNELEEQPSEKQRVKSKFITTIRALQFKNLNFNQNTWN